MGTAYYFIQRGEKGEIRQIVSSHSLGGGYKLGEFWVKNTIAPLREFLISTFGKGWKLESEHALNSCTLERILNIGYSKEVREFCVSNNLTSWGAIEMFDKIILTFEEGDRIPGFTDRYFPCYESKKNMKTNH